MSTSQSFDAYVIYLYIVMGLPIKEIAEHQGISKDAVSQIIKSYGFNYRGGYGAGQHFKAYPQGKVFQLKSGKKIELDLTQEFIELYVKSGNFYNNSFEDYLNRYFTPKEAPKPEHKQSPRKPDPPAEKEPKPESPEKTTREKKPLNPKLQRILKIITGITCAALVVLLSWKSGCIKFEEISCVGSFPSFSSGTSHSGVGLDLYFSALDITQLTSPITVLVDGEECETIDFTESENILVQASVNDGSHTVQIEINGEKSNLLSADLSSNSVMYIVVSLESGKPHISQTGG